MYISCQIASILKGFLPISVPAHCSSVSFDPPSPMPVMPMSVSTVHEHVALVEERVQVGRLVDADARDLAARQAAGARRRWGRCRRALPLRGGRCLRIVAKRRHRGHCRDRSEKVPAVHRRPPGSGYAVQQLLDRGDRVRRQIDVAGSDRLLNLLRVAGAGNGAGHRRVAQHPGQHQLRHADPETRRDRAQAVDELQVLRQLRLLEERVPAAPVVLAERGGALARERAGQQARLHRAVGDDADAVGRAPRQDLGLDLALQHAVGRLQRRDGRIACARCSCPRLKLQTPA